MAVLGLQGEELRDFIREYSGCLVDLKTLREKNKISSISNELKKAVRKGLITEEQKVIMIHKRRSAGAPRNINPKKLSDNECLALSLDRIYFDDNLKELASKYNISVGNMGHYINRAINKGLVEKQDWENAKTRRKGITLKGTRAKRQGDLGYSLGLGRITPEQRKEIGRKRMAQLTQEERKQLGIKARKAVRKNRYHVENRFYADSLGEGATALLLEKYVPNYRIQEGQTFQANGDTNCLYDFVLEDRILEWHPIVTDRDAIHLGLEEDLQALEELKSERNGKESRKAYSELARQFDEDLAIEYWTRRQDATDNSETYQGKQVDIARNGKELYQFLSQYSKLPSHSEFIKEFNQIKEQVRKYKVDKKLKAS